MIAASVELLPLPVGPVTSTIPFLMSTISFNCGGRLKSLKFGGLVGNNAHDDRVRAALFENIDAETGFAGRTERKIRRTALFQTFRRALVVANDQFRHARGVRGRELFQPGKVYRLKLAGELNLRRPAGRKNQIADLVRGFQHLPEDGNEV